MGKKSKKKQGLRFYFTLEGSCTIQSICAETVEEAAQVLDEKYGEGKYTLGHLNKALSKEEKKEMNEISEKVAGELFGETASRIMHDINSFY